MLIEYGNARIEEAHGIEQADEFVQFIDEHGQTILISPDAVLALAEAVKSMDFEK
jgi:hypothetical protein